MPRNAEVIRQWTEREYVMQFVMIFAGSSPFLLWWLLNKYLDKRDRRRKQQPR